MQNVSGAISARWFMCGLIKTNTLMLVAYTHVMIGWERFVPERRLMWMDCEGRLGCGARRSFNGAVKPLWDMHCGCMFGRCTNGHGMKCSRAAAGDVDVVLHLWSALQPGFRRIKAGSSGQSRRAGNRRPQIGANSLSNRKFLRHCLHHHFILFFPTGREIGV
jgi:hypothetical protein